MSLEGPILLIEDDAQDVQTLVMAIQELGISNPVQVCASAREGFDFLMNVQTQPLIILCDIKMPGIDGLSFRKQILEEPYLRKKSIPFVFFTGMVSKKIVDSAYELNVQGFFEKPKTYQELKDCLLVILLYWRRSLHPNRRLP